MQPRIISSLDERIPLSALAFLHYLQKAPTDRQLTSSQFTSLVTVAFDLMDQKSSTHQGAAGSSRVPNLVILTSILLRLILWRVIHTQKQTRKRPMPAHHFEGLCSKQATATFGFPLYGTIIINA